MGHITLRPQQAGELLTLMHAPFSREVGEERQDFAVGKGKPMVPVVHFWWPEQRHLQGTHANFSIINACPIQCSMGRLSGVGFSEGGHRVRRDGARLAGEGYLSPRQGALVERHLSPLSPCSKNLPDKSHG